jgi:hypothetical protein
MVSFPFPQSALLLQFERQIAANAIFLKRQLSSAFGVAHPNIFMPTIRSRRGG